MTSIDLSQSRVVRCNIPVSAKASTGICYNRPPSTEINRSGQTQVTDYISLKGKWGDIRQHVLYVDIYINMYIILLWYN